MKELPNTEETRGILPEAPETEAGRGGDGEQGNLPVTPEAGRDEDDAYRVLSDGPETEEPSDEDEVNGILPDEPETEEQPEAEDSNRILPEDLEALDLSGSDEDNDTDFLDEEALAELGAEEKFKHAMAVAKMAGRMQRFDYQDTYYRKALRELKPLFDTVEKAKPRFKKIRRKMHNARANHRIAAYRRACELRDSARTADDYAYAADQFAEIASYDIRHKLKEKFTAPELWQEAEKCTDCGEQEAWCRKREKTLLTRGRAKSTACLVLAAALVVCAVLFSRTAVFALWQGNLQAFFGSPEKSWESFYESWQRKADPKVYDKYLQYRYYAAAVAAESSDPESALEDLYALAEENYSDSAEMYAEIERKLLEKLNPGDKVTFSRVKWVVLDRDDSRLLLLKDSFVRKIPFQTDGAAVDWEHSSVRDFLSHEYYDERFLETERRMVLETTHETGANRLSGTDGGAATTDIMFLLSTEEAEQYVDILKDTEEAWWLRTPGTMPGTMSFVETYRMVNDTGYSVSSDQIRVRPAVWVETDKKKIKG